MFPGGRMNPKQMKAAMRRMGITQEEVDGVEEVVIRTKKKEIVFRDAAVTAVTMQGQTTYQVVGSPEERELSERGRAEEKGGVPTEDVELVMSQAGCSEEEARKALEECDGAPAEAILKIMASR
ncbi:MAG: nascent polypeptide-associated complex protein [Methanobacteriota archaeon]|nr:MAG: nascent polypeptide-associated complex protein [Euryarchaeota archaeon]